LPVIANSVRSRHFPRAKFQDAVPLFQMGE
jgi:hypothetical protein